MPNPSSQTHVKFKASKGSPKPTKVLSSGAAKHFVPGKSNQAFSTQGGTKK
jgi:hypothetical protein